jgi:DMSO/TMAO reductase YedYZ molybdopterin-dependent catalytic subunit
MTRKTLGNIGLGALLVLGLAQAASPALAQALSLRGPTGAAVALTAADIAAMTHVTLAASIDGRPGTYRGVPLATLLARVGAPGGKQLRGPALGDVVLISASDGYCVALALADTDPMMRKDQVILADAADGQPLPAGAGPYRLVVEGDLRGARAVRGVTAIEVRQLSAAGGG